MEKRVFGKVADGTEYSIWSFTNKNNMTMTLTDLGATIVNVFVPDKDGVVRDMVLGYDTPQEYLDNDGNGDVQKYYNEVLKPHDTILKGD